MLSPAFAGLKTTDAFDLGLTPQALCLRLLRRPRADYLGKVPLLSLIITLNTFSQNLTHIL